MPARQQQQTAIAINVGIIYGRVGLRSAARSEIGVGACRIEGMANSNSQDSAVDSLFKPVPPSGQRTVLKLLFASVFVVVLGSLLWYVGPELTLSRMALREAAFRQYQQEHPTLVYFVAFAIYVTVTGLSLPGATGMTLLTAWLFGFWRALLVVSLASTAGATVAFLFSRYLFRDLLVRRFGDRLTTFNSSLDKDGPFYLFTLRLIPAVPFFVINAVMGLTLIRVLTFSWVSLLGMLPGTMVYVYAGSRVPALQQLAEKGVYSIFSPGQMIEILIALALLGIAPWVGRELIGRIQTSKKR